MKRGYFITFEGGEGAGKSTQINLLANRMNRAGLPVVITREPGGSPGAEAIRHVILSGAAEPFGHAMEAILFAAARADHIDQVIRPAIEDGVVVLCDRFIDSTRVYQGATGNTDAEFMRALEEVTVNGIMPDLTIILDIDPEIGLARAARRRGASAADRFEKEEIALHRRRRQAFLDIAAAEPQRCLVVDASRSEADVAEAIRAGVAERLAIPLALREESA